ncbi:hypothetical protein [Streptomyces gilvosporeus]|uniref:Uncharacterized protein n=1 Tax=Streptomyces gilvosporeus TaxID=553510 RepID=A0A1V0TLS0_9ACTN|nr:hypothetical protein [Streptomyces gilvosporeus]ARF53612.1 hypothetical protein B1H19_04960 [Streptomyces gilvosporeus]
MERTLLPPRFAGLSRALAASVAIIRPGDRDHDRVAADRREEVERAPYAIAFGYLAVCVGVLALLILLRFFKAPGP